MKETAKLILEHPRNQNILFDKDLHKYTYIAEETPVEFRGWTSFLKTFTAPFDKERIAKGVAYNRGISVDQVYAEWDEATQYGNKVHDAIENLIKTGEYDDDVSYELDSFIKMYTEEGLTPVTCEWVVYNERMERASAIDGVFVDEKDRMVIVDFKTYKDMTLEGYKGKNMLYPIINIPDSKYHYTCLQILSYERWLKELYPDVPMSDTHYIFHIRPDKHGSYPVFPMYKAVDKIHDHFDLIHIK